MGRGWAERGKEIRGRSGKGEWPLVRRRGCETKEEGKECKQSPLGSGGRVGEGGGKLREEGEGGNSFLPLCPLEGLWPTTRVKRNSSTYTYIYIYQVYICVRASTCDRTGCLFEKRKFVSLRERFFPPSILVKVILVN